MLSGAKFTEVACCDGHNIIMKFEDNASPWLDYETLAYFLSRRVFFYHHTLATGALPDDIKENVTHFENLSKSR